MFSDEEIKEIQFTRPGDELISIREVCLGEKRDLFLYHDNYPQFTNKSDVCGLRFRSDNFYCESLEQSNFSWTDEDGIASLVSEPSFESVAQNFGKDFDATFEREIKKEITTPTNMTSEEVKKPWFFDTNAVSSTSTEPNTEKKAMDLNNKGKQSCKVDKGDPRTRMHYLKFIKRIGRVIKLWECSICGREFQHQYTLIRHLPTHTDERNFHCSTCGKSFRQLSTLTQHRAIHSSERPYACELCNKTFNRVSTLISHRKTHSENKPYKCHICPKGFHQKGNLRNHLFTHTNERPYRCNVCLKGFNQQSNLVCHKNKAHPEDTEKASTSTEKRNDVRPPISNNEVTSTMDTKTEPTPSIWSPNSGLGVLVDPINTYHMGVALARKQTPFALLKPSDCPPVLVKIVDAKLPGGKQMLVPATAEDLRTGGKIVVNNDCPAPLQDPLESCSITGAVQIRVPVVATVIPKFQSGGRLHLAVEEPHHAFHTALSSDIPDNLIPKTEKDPLRVIEPSKLQACPVYKPKPVAMHTYTHYDEHAHKLANDSSYLFNSGQFSPPLDMMSPMDLFGAMEGIPMGPQVTAVNNIDELPRDDDSDIFIGEFEESIPISESD